jgi:sugar phosphate isomerase/epimerase
MLTRRLLLQAALGAVGKRVRIGLNAYSFDKPLRDGSLTLSDVVQYCAAQGIDALDATGYYFPGYPAVPADDFVRKLRREAFLHGVSIFGTGVRNDFSIPGNPDVQLVKNWIEVAARLGASIVRIFSGRAVPPGRTFDEVLKWMAPAMAECADYGRKHGVMIGLQNHNDFLKTADETIRVVKAVNSEWFGVILDIGSLRQNDPYAEIEKLVPYAVSWQLKEKVGYGTREEPTDLRKVKDIIDRAGYRGMLPIETLGPGDPKVKVAKFLSEVRAVFG